MCPFCSFSLHCIAFNVWYKNVDVGIDTPRDVPSRNGSPSKFSNSVRLPYNELASLTRILDFRHTLSTSTCMLGLKYIVSGSILTILSTISGGRSTPQAFAAAIISIIAGRTTFNTVSPANRILPVSKPVIAQMVLKQAL